MTPDLDTESLLEPKVLIAITGYRYGGKKHDRATALAEIVAGLPALRHVVVVDRGAHEPAPNFVGTPHELKAVMAVCGLFNLLFFVYPGPLVGAATAAAKSLF